MKKYTKHHFEFISVLSVFLVVAIYAMSLFFASANTKISMMRASVVSNFEMDTDPADITEISKFQGVYSDVDVDSEYYEAAAYFYDHGLLDGVEQFRDGVFGVDELITRGELMVFIGDVFDFDLSGGDYSGCFSDVSGSIEPFVCYSFAKGIVNGVADNIFAPNDEINFKGFLKIVLVSANVDFLDISTLDVSEIEGVELKNWVYPYLAYAIDNQIISNFNADSLEKGVKRGDAMNMVYKLKQSL